MEVMPAAMVMSLLALTYLVFAGGCVLIARRNMRGTATLPIPRDGGGACPWLSSSESSSSMSSSNAAGCTEFAPANGSLAASAVSTASSVVLEGSYGALFSANFAGLEDLYGSVSLHASFENETALESLPDPAVVDLFLEACTEDPATVEETCGRGWELVLLQV